MGLGSRGWGPSVWWWFENWIVDASENQSFFWFCFFVVISIRNTLVVFRFGRFVIISDVMMCRLVYSRSVVAVTVETLFFWFCGLLARAWGGCLGRQDR